MAGVLLARSSPRISSYSLSMSTRCLPSLSPLSPPPRPSRPASSMLPARRLADPRSTISHRALVRSSAAVADRFEGRFATRRGTRRIAFWRRCRSQEVGSLGNTETCRRSLMPGSIVCRTLESAIRNCEEFQATAKDVEKILDWENTSHKQVEIPFNLCSPPGNH